MNIAKIKYLWPCLIVLSLLVCGCGKRSHNPADPRTAMNKEDEPIRMTDVTKASGLHFIHRNGGSGRLFYVETMSGGCAFLDYDRDGWQDIFLVQGAPLPGYKPAAPLRSALYHNNKDGTFTDVTKGSGLDIEMYGMAPAVGDYDNDGRPDLFVTALHGNHLFHNEGNGKFRDVTKKASLAGKDMSTGAAWLDYDNDGHLDLFVCRYTDYLLENDNLRCSPDGLRTIYCHPTFYRPTHSLLYRNNGDGTFADVTGSSHIGGRVGRSLGVVCADFNSDGWIDIYVSNDMTPSFVFLNRGNGTFQEQGRSAGVLSLGKYRSPPAGMGIDYGDYQNDGRASIIITNFQEEPISFYQSNGDGTFNDRTRLSGIGSPGSLYLKWGCRFVDLDLDGFLDLFVVNGHLHPKVDEYPELLGYAQPSQVFRNKRGTFREISRHCGDFFAGGQVGRGAAFGDYDNDSDTDVLIACNNSPPVLLRNNTPQRYRWIRLSLQGSARPGHRGCNRDALGASVRVTANGVTQTQVARSATSYLSDHDRRLLFGIGQDQKAQVEVKWPCGVAQKLIGKANSSTMVQEVGCKLKKSIRR